MASAALLRSLRRRDLALSAYRSLFHSQPHLPFTACSHRSRVVSPKLQQSKMASLMPETAQKIFTLEKLRSAVKQSQRCLSIPTHLRRAIEKLVSEQDEPHMRRKVLRLLESLNDIKSVNRQLSTATAKELVDDPLKSMESSKRWKVKSAYGDIGFKYRDDETVAYVASRMPAVYSACYRVLSEVSRRLPDFSPTKVLDFGAGTGSAFWALREVWPRTLEKVNLVEPSQSMQRAGQSLIQGLKNLPLIHSYDSLQTLNKKISKADRKHDLVIASYVLGEIPSLKDQITIVRQLWDLTDDVLILVEPGTPQGSKIIAQMRSHILWMEKRKFHKDKPNEASKDLVDLKTGNFVVAPCPHDGACPLENSGKYCHFVQRLERTSTQRAYKGSKGKPLRGFEDEKFCYVAIRRGQRPQIPWPLDGIKFLTRKEERANRNLEDHETDYDMSEAEDGIVSNEEMDGASRDSGVAETDVDQKSEEEAERDEETGRADVGNGWGRVLGMPVQRGRHVTIPVCVTTKPDGSEGALEQIVLTRSNDPSLHKLARKTIWGDLWPLSSARLSYC